MFFLVLLLPTTAEKRILDTHFHVANVIRRATASATNFSSKPSIKPVYEIFSMKDCVLHSVSYDSYIQIGMKKSLQNYSDRAS